jgi:rfaE bifunctional protein nucleotidyltransferase chain/domain
VGKRVSQDQLILLRRDSKRNALRVVVVGGCFDLLHPGHIRLLEQARSLGNVLVVAIHSDAAVRSLKGLSSVSPSAIERPINPSAERAEIVASLAAVDYVVELENCSFEAFLDRLAPDVIVRGSNAAASPAANPGARTLAPSAASGPGTHAAKLVDIPLEPGYSTAQLLERIKHLRHLNA